MLTCCRASGWGRAPRWGRPSSSLRPPPRRPVNRPTRRRPRVREAFDAVAAELRRRAQTAGGTTGEVLEATALMAADPGLLAVVDQRLAAGPVRPPPSTRPSSSSARSSRRAARTWPNASPTCATCATASWRACWGCPNPVVPQLHGPSVVVARDLAPADTAALDLSLVVGIVTELGGPTSHTAIIAAQFDIPCVVRVAGALDLVAGTELALDARAGTVTPDPSAGVREEIAGRRAARAALASSAGGPGARPTARRSSCWPTSGPSRTPTGLRRRTSRAWACSAPRSCSSTGRARPRWRSRPTPTPGCSPPSATARSSCGRWTPVPTNRRLRGRRGRGENPALGVRGLRTSRRHPELLATQLAALAAAAERTGTQPWVMAPMVSTPAEAAEFVAQARAAGLRTVGAMVEVPAAALRAQRLVAAGLDFVSLGTNDLTQYAMAADRLEGDLADLLDPWQPAVLQLVQATAPSTSPWAFAARPHATRCWPSCSSVSACAACRWRPRPSRPCGFALSRNDLGTCVKMAEAALEADSPQDAREAAARSADADVLAL